MFRYLLIVCFASLGVLHSLSQEHVDHLEWIGLSQACSEGDRVLCIGEPDPRIFSSLLERTVCKVVSDTAVPLNEAEQFDSIVVPFTFSDVQTLQAALEPFFGLLKPLGTLYLYIEVFPGESFYQIADAVLSSRGLARSDPPQTFHFRSGKAEFDEVQLEQIEQIASLSGGFLQMLEYHAHPLEVWSIGELADRLEERFAGEWSVPPDLRVPLFAELASRYIDLVGGVSKEEYEQEAVVIQEEGVTIFNSQITWPSELSSDDLIYYGPTSGYALFEIVDCQPFPYRGSIP